MNFNLKVDYAAPGYTGIVELHNTIFFYLIIICSTIYYFNNKNSPIVHKYLNHALILIAIAFPSFRLLYLLDEVISPTITIKVVEFDSYMIPESDLELGQFRLLDVDNKVIIPVDCHIRLIITGADVIHSFAIPSLGLKIDAVPGRLNQSSIIAERTGTFYGQCSEICGV
ncbi:cytochrome oxidse subunit 2 [Lactarius sanguifluus]|nr:cytochrome oxidse subunit 2 [Lactarius sanguifluus]